ncbi:MAG: UDP-N-acetylglucosamine 2-epimerase (non-hydrolyzing) [Terracidiphilus sp.]
MPATKRKKILSVFGTRPEAIKMAPVIRAMLDDARAQCVTCVTGQHRQMLDQVLDLFGIQPDYDLNIMVRDQTLAHVTSKVLEKLDQILAEQQPDWIVVQGDTTSAMAAALAGFYRRVPVAHVEAGLRTNDVFNPYPEEVNRRYIDCVASVHFAATERNRDVLLREGVSPFRILVTGNTVIDALLHVAGKPFSIEKSPLAGIPFAEKRIVLVTAHRRENWGSPMREICAALRQIAMRNPDVHIVYPVHLNPSVYAPVYESLDGLPNISLLAPLDYLSFMQLAKRSYLVLTDSGGIQEEMPSLGKPVLVMRKVTERAEALEAGTAVLVGTSARAIAQGAAELLENSDRYRAMVSSKNPYGDGLAARRISDRLLADEESVKDEYPAQRLVATR